MQSASCHAYLAKLRSDLTTKLFGQTFQAPFGIAPIGLTGLMWPDGERMLARTAAEHGIPFCLSCVACETPEVIGPLAGGRCWFQLYPPRDRAVRNDLLRRARDSGFSALIITVDVPIYSVRERQRRAGLTMPPRVRPRMVYHAAVRPAWTHGNAAAWTAALSHT